MQLAACLQLRNQENFANGSICNILNTLNYALPNMYDPCTSGARVLKHKWGWGKNVYRYHINKRLILFSPFPLIWEA